MKKYLSMREKAIAHNQRLFLFILPPMWSVPVLMEHTSFFDSIGFSGFLFVGGLILFIMNKYTIRIPKKKIAKYINDSNRFKAFLLLNALIFAVLSISQEDYRIELLPFSLILSSMFSYMITYIALKNNTSKLRNGLTLVLLPVVGIVLSFGAMAIGVLISGQHQASSEVVLTQFDKARNVASIDASDVKIKTKKIEPSTFIRIGVLRLEKIEGRETVVIINKDKLDVNFLKKDRLKCSNSNTKSVCFPESYYKNPEEFVNASSKAHTVKYMMKSVARLLLN